MFAFAECGQPNRYYGNLRRKEYSEDMATVQRNNSVFFELRTLVRSFIRFKMDLVRKMRNSKKSTSKTLIDVELIQPISDPGDILKTSEFLFSSYCSDVKVCCNDSQFSAHKLILGNKCSVLREKFSQHSLEKTEEEGILQIEGTEPDVVEEFLRFIYTGSAGKLTAHATELYSLAAKYHLHELKTIAETSILSTLSPDNVLDRYNMSKTFNSDKIASACLEYIKIEKKSIWKTKDELGEAMKKSPELFLEIMMD